MNLISQEKRADSVRFSCLKIKLTPVFILNANMECKSHKAFFFCDIFSSGRTTLFFCYHCIGDELVTAFSCEVLRKVRNRACRPGPCACFCRKGDDAITDQSALDREHSNGVSFLDDQSSNYLFCVLFASASISLNSTFVFPHCLLCAQENLSLLYLHLF